MDSSADTIPFDDPIVAEVRKASEKILDSFGSDHKAMLRDVRRRQDERQQKAENTPPHAQP